MSSICAVVTSLPESRRRRLLTDDATWSVFNQIREPDDMVIGIDFSRIGEVENMNRLIRSTKCDWLAFLHDDDVWYDDHLSTCEKHFDADVVVSRFELIGRPEDTIEPWHEDFEDLRFTNWIGSPSMVVVRREAFGEFCEPSRRYRWVDWSNWNRLLDNDCVFADTKQVTVQYRFGPWSNGSWQA